jgi:hypothetical protein
LQIKVINGKIISKVPMREFLFEPRHTPIGGMSFSLFKCIAAVYHDFSQGFIVDRKANLSRLR